MAARVPAGGEDRLADLDRPLAHGFLFDQHPPLALDGGRRPVLIARRGIGRVDDGVDLQVGDVAALDGDDGRIRL